VEGRGWGDEGWGWGGGGGGGEGDTTPPCYFELERSKLYSGP
jgi:hypothetical protein